MKKYAIALLLCLAGCYTGSGTESTETPAPVTEAIGVPSDVPIGIETPKPVIGYYSGIYKALGAEPCCWITDKAEFQTQVGAKAKAIVLTVLLPELPIYRDRPQSLAVQIDSGKPVQFNGLTVGQHELRVAVSAPQRGKVVKVRVSAAYAFVPQHEHINGDTRKLAVYLRNVKSI